MPKTGDRWVQSCPAITQLDDHLNSDEQKKASYSSALTAGENPAFVSGGPLVESNANWGTAWVDSDGHGGTYWPYATEVDLAGLIKGALTESVKTATDSGKIHNTLWILSGNAPEEYQQGHPVAKAKQEELFKVAVHETDRVVSLVIMTPEPV